MYFLLMDTHGSALDTFAEESEAVHAWEEMVQSDPATHEEVAILRCDDDGRTLERVHIAHEAHAEPA
jgi:hypothetical protein